MKSGPIHNIPFFTALHSDKSTRLRVFFLFFHKIASQLFNLIHIEAKSSNCYDRSMEKSLFISNFAKDIRNEQAAIFVGAGVSMGSDLPSWKEFAKDFADELGLDINNEFDLISLFQYYVNKRRCRNELNQRIFCVLGKDVPTNSTHAALAALPIRTYWTTNCDELLEKAFREKDKTVFVKRRKTDLTLQKPDSDITLYKMHGDVQDPQHAVFTKDDYDYYPVNNAPFLDHLRSDLCSKTFLFVGFSLDDPNLKHALSQLHISFGDSMRTHYLIYKRIGRPTKRGQNEEGVFEYQQHDEVCSVGPDYEVCVSHLKQVRVRKVEEAEKAPRATVASTNEEEQEIERIRKHEELWMEDLARYGIQTVVIDDFSEIPQILNKLREKINMKEIFISGSFTNFSHSSIHTESDSSEPQTTKEGVAGKQGPMGPAQSWKTGAALDFSYYLAQALVSKGNRIITGFGAGVGNSMIRAILTYTAKDKSQKIEKCVLGLPFEQDAAPKSTLKTLWRNYRQSSLKQAGIAIFIFGEPTDNPQERKKSKGGLSAAEETPCETDTNEQETAKTEEQQAREEQRKHKNRIIESSQKFDEPVAEGMMEEFRIACEQESCFIIPVALTGRTPHRIWKLIEKEIENFLPPASTEEQKEFNREVISKLTHLNQQHYGLLTSKVIKNVIKEITDLICFLQDH